MLASENVQKQNLQNLMYHGFYENFYFQNNLYVYSTYVLAYMYMYKWLDGNHDQILGEQCGLKATINDYIHMHLKLTPTM